jgi:hypothetical protein
MGKLIWLASYPKSGNTWLRAFLHNLLHNAERSFDINRLTSFCIIDSLAHHYAHVAGRDGEAAFDASDAAAIARLRPTVHRLFTRASPDNRFVKTHLAFAPDHDVPTITPDATAGAIYVLRNPLDVAVSYAHHLGASLDATIALMAQPGYRTRASAEWVGELMGSWSEHVTSWVDAPLPRLHVVRYEDMHAQPIKTFGGIAAFLGLKPPRERLERAIRLSSFKVLQEQERRHGFAEKSTAAASFFREGRAEAWRRALDDDQVVAVVGAHRAVMERFGYLPGKQRHAG